jgi:hypothetical protein
MYDLNWTFMNNQPVDVARSDISIGIGIGVDINAFG